MEDKTVWIQAKLPESMRDEFKEVAKSNAQNPSALIRVWIEKYLKESK